MSHLASEVRRGAYFDSIVLLQLQVALRGLPAVEDAGVVMATAANLALLASQDLGPPQTLALTGEDLLVVVKAETSVAADRALAQVDRLLSERRGASAVEYQPHSLTAALEQLPSARWATISVPGRHAARLAHQALDLGLNVFLYSDNVALADEVALKRKAAARGLLVMGPDCGTAVIAGTGLGFANRVAPGSIGLIGASGTGLQAVLCHLDQLGVGVSHAIGTGGRDLSAEVQALTARQGLDLLRRDASTRVVVLLSKPPSPSVAADLLAAARAVEKPVVVNFIGYPPPAPVLDNLYFATGLKATAELAASLFVGANPRHFHRAADRLPAAHPPLVRGLFAGGTLAYEALQGLRDFLSPLASNLHLPGVLPLADLQRSAGHTLLDLGDDAFTVGRLHPMLDADLRLRRLRQEAADPQVGFLLLDVILGDGAHPDPAAELAPLIAELRAQRPLEVLVILLGTERDPQGRDGQEARLCAAGAQVFTDPCAALDALLRQLGPQPPKDFTPLPHELLEPPFRAINCGLASFADSLTAQGAEVVHLDWRPPAGGNEALLAILDKMREKADASGV